jgi:glycosyltransferase involved in cell wall biosynthesis
MIVFLSDIPFDSMKQRPQYIAERLNVPVLFVEPLTLGHRWKHFKEVAVGVTALSVPMLPYNARNKVIRWVAYALGCMGFDRILRRVRRLMVPKADLYYIQNFQMIDLVDWQKRTVFDYIDNGVGFAKYPLYVHRLLASCLVRADFRISTNPLLLPGAEIIPNGVDLSKYRKRVGYIGAISTWFDIELMGELAAALPNVDVVLIGRVSPRVRKEFDWLKSYPNVVFMGEVPHERIPIYLSALDVGLIPFKRNGLTEAVNPVKMYEYAAAGLPMVATDFAELPAEVSVAGNAESFITAVRCALSIGKSERLKRYAAKNTWDVRAGEIRELLGLPNEPIKYNSGME